MKKFLFIFILCIFLPGAGVQASQIYFFGPAEVFLGEKFEVVVKVDTEGELINSADINFIFDESKIKFLGYKVNEGVIKLWVNSPAEKEGVLNFSGIIPGGVSALYSPDDSLPQDLPLAVFIFEAVGLGEVNLDFTKTEILKHDGLGTSLPSMISNLAILIKQPSNLEQVIKNELEILDQNKPESFKIIFLDSGFFSKTPPILIFNTNDSGSGIKEYKISSKSDVWETVSSPFAVKKSLFDKEIRIRAYDFYGNFEESYVIVPGALNHKPALIFFAFLALCLVLYKVLKLKHD